MGAGAGAGASTTTRSTAKKFFIKLLRLFVVIKVEQLSAKQRTFNMICDNGSCFFFVVRKTAV